MYYSVFEPPVYHLFADSVLSATRLEVCRHCMPATEAGCFVSMFHCATCPLWQQQTQFWRSSGVCARFFLLTRVMEFAHEGCLCQTTHGVNLDQLAHTLQSQCTRTDTAICLSPLPKSHNKISRDAVQLSLFLPFFHMRPPAVSNLLGGIVGVLPALPALHGLHICVQRLKVRHLEALQGSGKICLKQIPLPITAG